MISKFDNQINDVYKTLIEYNDKDIKKSVKRMSDELADDYDKQGIIKKAVKSVTDREEQALKQDVSSLRKQKLKAIKDTVPPYLRKQIKDVEEFKKTIDAEKAAKE